MEYFGNKDIIKLYKTAFFCSRKCPADIVLKSLDWAKSKKDNEECVISGFHSRIEKDVFDILLKGTQPLIMVLARGMKKRWPEEIKKAVKQEKLLIISPFDKKITYITQETANKRNEIMADIADEVFLAYATPNGNLDELLKGTKNKTIEAFE
ncbi:MAG: DNA-binding protein [Deltaproteobacteria bacterium]|nr:DNA-binding protein [Deltaproteobacteria bacterium]